MDCRVSVSQFSLFGVDPIALTNFLATIDVKTLHPGSLVSNGKLVERVMKPIILVEKDLTCPDYLCPRLSTFRWQVLCCPQQRTVRSLGASVVSLLVVSAENLCHFLNRSLLIPPVCILVKLV